MYDPLGPVAELGPMVLHEQLVEGAAKAHDTMRHLNLNELVALAEAAEQVARMARHYIERVCGLCRAPISWNPNQPTGQGAGWRHTDQAGSYRYGGHRAIPEHDTTGCPAPTPDRPALNA
jgi:hypothetical protein